VNRRQMIVAGTAAALLGAFGAGAYFVAVNRTGKAVQTAELNALVRPHSPVIGPVNAPVTIVEFFDPSCEACRAFHPIVKQILDRFPGKVRVVIRYAAFHRGSDEAVRILETARLQGMFLPVLDALLEAQPQWAAHGSPRLERAWNVAAQAGLEVERARRERLMPHIAAALNFDAADVATLGIKSTPTFYVNGKPLAEFGPQQLLELVQSEVNRS
jgi:protein-disulfide isomerase